MKNVRILDTFPIGHDPNPEEISVRGRVARVDVEYENVIVAVIEDEYTLLLLDGEYEEINEKAS